MSIKIVTANRKARHDYLILDTLETGIVLQGTEVKSIRDGKISLKDSFALIENDGVYLHSCHISPYTHGNYNNHEPMRTRKLLLHKREIAKLLKSTSEKGLALIPLKAYFKKGKVKIELSVAKGKKLYDKRETLKKRTVDKEIRAAIKTKNQSSD